MPRSLRFAGGNGQPYREGPEQEQDRQSGKEDIDGLQESGPPRQCRMDIEHPEGPNEACEREQKSQRKIPPEDLAASPRPGVQELDEIDEAEECEGKKEETGQYDPGDPSGRRGIIPTEFGQGDRKTQAHRKKRRRNDIADRHQNMRLRHASSLLVHTVHSALPRTDGSKDTRSPHGCAVRPGGGASV